MEFKKKKKSFKRHTKEVKRKSEDNEGKNWFSIKNGNDKKRNMIIVEA